MEENRQLVGNICASIEELGNVIVDNVAASHKDYEMMIASLDRSIAEMKKRSSNPQLSSSASFLRLNILSSLN